MKVKKIKSSKIWKKVLFGSVCCAFGWYLHGKMVPTQTGGYGLGVPQVLVQDLESKNVSLSKKYIAQVEAVNSVDIIPQVSGYLEETLFKDGAFVQAGDKIFVIEQRKYKAELKSTEAHLKQSQKEYDRIAKLHKTGDVTDKQLDIATSQLSQAEAQYDLAKLNLEHSEIKAPISGYIGKALVANGNLVSPNTQKLARIIQTNPIRISFSVTDKERYAFLKKTKESKDIFVDILLPDGTIKSVDAKNIFAGNEVNSQTATIPVYLDVDNEDYALVSGNYVDIYFRFNSGEESLLVPQVALASDVHGTYVMTVDKNNKAVQKYVVLGDIVEDMQVVLSGLNKDDKVVVQGLQKVQNGAPVQPTIVLKNK